MYNFIERYYHYELRAFCWIQITEKEASELENIGLLVKGLGYRYNQPETGVPMVEYHVDSCELFQEQMNQKTAFGQKPEFVVQPTPDDCARRNAVSN